MHYLLPIAHKAFAHNDLADYCDKMAGRRWRGTRSRRDKKKVGRGHAPVRSIVSWISTQISEINC